jgi:F-type H+-transporting ATPase subunit b
MNMFDFYIPEKIFVALSLLILVFILKRIFWEPVIRIIDDRQKGVDDMLQNAKDAQRIIDKMAEQRAHQESYLERQASERMKNARDRAGREYERIINEAKEKAHKIVAAGEEAARREYQQVMVKSREAIISLALGAASIIVESSMDSEKNRELIEAMLRRDGVGGHG